MKVLNAGRAQLNTDRTRANNALTALVRSYDLGIDARRALTVSQIKQIRSWRARNENLGIATARTEAIRLARAITTLDADLATNRNQINIIVTRQTPKLLTLKGIGPINAALILAAWSHPGRIHSEAALAKLAGTCPIPASSGNTTRHRLNRGGDRHLNKAIHTIALARIRTDEQTRKYLARRAAEGHTTRETIRCLKRYITRQIYRTLTATPTTMTA